MPLWRRHQQAHDAPPPPPTAPAPQQHSPSQAIGVRQRWQVERLLASAHRWSADIQRDPFKVDGTRRTDEWERGIIAAARWALGELESAPISGTYTGLGVIPDIDVMEEEDDQAEWALRHPREVGHSSKYANGVQHTMMWIVGDTDDSPIGFEGSTDVIPGQR